MENKELTTYIYDQYLEAKEYTIKTDMEERLQMCVDFYEGRQWGKVGEKTKKLPRATFNITELIVNTKVSSMLEKPYKVIFTSKEMPKQAEKLTRFNALMEKEMDFERLCEEIVEQGAIEGSSFIHFFWDSDAIGKRGEYKGGVRAEKINPLDIFVENPYQNDIQKQKWIILCSKLNKDDVLKLCEREQDKKYIVYDDFSGTTPKVTVLTKYFKNENDNQVYFIRSTKNVILHQERGVNPQSTTQFKANLYPVEVYQYKNKKNSIYGRGEVEPIIANNRTINFNTAMMSKGVEDQGFGTIVQREGALKVGEKITNDSSKVLIDRYKGGQNGFYSLTKQPFTPEAYQLNKDIIETTRLITGVTSIMTGEVMYNNQSGKSIAYLQQQAMKPLEKLCKRYKIFRKQCAEILYQFYCLYYENKEFKIYNQKDVSLPNDNITIIDTFNSEEYKKIDFDISVEVGTTKEYDEAIEIELLDKFLKDKLIPLKTYCKLYPDNLLPGKERILAELENLEKEQIKI